MNLKSQLSLALKLVLLIGTGGVSAAASANEVNDPSFEGTTANWNLVDSTTSFVSSPTRTGTKALRLEHVGDGVTPNTRTVWQQNGATVTPGLEYTYDVWVQGNNLEGSSPGGRPLAVVRWRDKDGEIIKTHTQAVAQESFRFANFGTYPFTQSSMLMHLQAPAKAFSADLGFRSWRETIGGFSYWDDVNLRPRDISGLGDRLASYEVEDASILTGGTLSGAHIDHSGSGYYDVNVDGAVIEWNNVISGANRTVAVRFSWEGSPRDIELLVNGTRAGKSEPIPTGRRGTWATHTFTGVNLPNASNTVRLVVNRVGGEKLQPMIDRIDIHAAGNETTPTNVPLNVAATNETFTEGVRLTWDPVIGANRYEVIRTEVAGALGTLYAGITGNSFEDENTEELATYYYRVRACNSTTCTTLSPQVAGVRGVDVTRLDIDIQNTDLSSNVDLTAIGVSDWIAWGRVSNTSVDRKAGVPAVIPNFTTLNGANPQLFVNTSADYTWSDGVPTASSTQDHGLRMFDEDAGVQWVLPADQTERELRMFLGVNSSVGTVIASLSDGSKPNVTINVSESFKASRTVIINYSAESPGQTLTVSFIKGDNTGHISFDALALIVPNQAPVWNNTPDQTAVEDRLLTIGLSSSDSDGPTTTTITQTNTLPGSPTNILTDNGDGTGTINWIPALGDSNGGPYTITVTATDGDGASSSQTINVTVVTNSPPLIDAISDKGVIEGSALNFTFSAADADGPAPLTLTQSNNLPGQPNILIDNGDGTGTIAWLSAAGNSVGSPYQVTVIATDGDGAVSNETFNIVVNSSQPPVLDAVSDLAAVEGRTLTVALSATDPDGPNPITISGTSNLPGNPAFVSSTGSGTATLSYTPSLGDSGNYTATLTATDAGGSIDSQTINIVVSPNQLPLIDAIAAQTAVEGQLLTVDVNAIDADGPLPINLTAVDNLPGALSINDNNDGTGSLQYTPAAGENAGGPYTVTVTATDGQGGTDSETFSVSVVENTPPTLQTVGAQSVREQESLTVNLLASDDDGPAPLTLSQTNTLPGNPANLLSDNGDGTGTLNWTPQAGDAAGSPYSVVITATDGAGLTVSETLSIEVLPQGTGGTLNFSGGNVGNFVQLHTEGTADWIHMGRGSVTTALNRKSGVTPMIGAFEILPGTTAFAANNNITTYSWNQGTPVFQDNQETTGLRAFADGRGYKFSVAAGLSPRTLKVYLGANRAVGRFEARLSDASASEAVNIVTSPNGRARKVFTITFAAGLPGQTLDMEWFMDGPPNGSGWVGIDAATLQSSNLPPAIEPIADQNATEGQPFSVALNAIDADGPTPLTLSVSHALPGSPNILTDNGNGTGTLVWTPQAGDAGSYPITITATDGDGEPSIETFTLTVSANAAPVIDPIADQSTTEGQLLSFAVNATDTDGPSPLVLSATTTIPGNPAVFTDNGSGSGTFSWTPATGAAAGSPYSVTIRATDNDGLFSEEVVTISLSGSEPPVLSPIGDLTIVENRRLQLNISATDVDGPTPLSFSDSNTIGQSILTNDSGNGTATLLWTPPVGAAANSPYTQTVTVSDAGGTTDSETITITVVPNQAPVITPIGSKTVVENNPLAFTVFANDPDGAQGVSFSQTNTLPGNPNILSDNGNNTASVVWSAPLGGAANPNNPFSVTVTATDSEGATSVETFAVTVSTSEPPVLNSIGGQAAIEQVAYSLNVSANDPDGPNPLSFSMVHNLPGSPVLTDNGNGNAVLNWAPQVGDAAGSPYSVTISVEDAGGTTATETFSVDVEANISPVLAPIGDQTAVENVNYSLTLVANDDPGAAPVTFSAVNNLPNSPTILTDNGDNTATLTYLPGLDENNNSPYSITVTVTDENGIQDEETFAFRVVRGGRLTGSGLPAPAAVDLSALGVSDWAHFGLGGNASINRKSGVTPLIPNFTPVNGANPQSSTAAKSTYTWADGSPTTNSTNRANVRIFENEKGVALALPAGRSERLARIYVGASSATGILRATLSDNSAPLFTTNIVAGAKLTREISLVYRSGSDDQTLDITFEKSGSTGWVSLDAVTIENLNEAPVLATIGDQNVVENQPLSIALNAVDVDGPAPIAFSQSNNLPGVPDILTDNGDGTASLDWTPSPGDEAGSPYQVTLTVADDAGEEASQTFSITVAANTAPTVTPIPDQALLEGETLSLSIVSTDTDGPAPITLTQTNNLPSAPSFVDNGDGTGSFSWTPGSGESGPTPFTVTITATDADNMASTEVFTVGLSSSLPPVLAPIGNQTVIEGRSLLVPLSASDADGPFPLLFSDSNNIGSSIIVNEALSWSPPAGSAGIYNETVTVTDAGGSADAESIIITVLADQPPILASVGTLSAFENAPFSYTFMANDPDELTAVSYTQNNNLPGNAVFVDNGDNTATLSMNAATGDAAGSPYSMTVSVTDSFGNVDTETFAVTVSKSQPPVIGTIDDQTATEGVALGVSVTATDSDGPAPITLTQTNTLPGSPEILSDNGNGTGDISWIPGPGDSFAGPYSITVTATDGAGESSSESFSITVNRNGLISMGQVVNDGANVNLTSEGPSDWVHWGLGGNDAVDRKANVAAQITNLTVLNGANPVTADIMDADYSWSDGSPTPSSSGTNSGLRVFENNKGIQISAPAGLAERTLKLYVGLRSTAGTITARLSDGSVADVDLTLNQPSGKSSRLVTINYKAGTNGQSLIVDYLKSSSGGWISLESAALDAVNSEPSIIAIGDQQATEGNPLTIALNATDDGPAPIVWEQTNNLPGAPDILTNFGTGVAELNWTPEVGDAGTYSITVTATDAASASSTETFSVTVVENLDPTLVQIDNQSAVQQVPFSLNIVANDIDGPGFPALTQTNTIGSADLSLTDNGDGTGTINWTPAVGTAANSPVSVTVTATAGVGNTDTQTFQIAVTSSFAPVLNAVGNQQVIENRMLTVPLSATDADGAASLVFSQANSNLGANLVSTTGNGTGVLSYTPGTGAAGTYTLDVVVTDGGGDSDRETISITVLPNQAPVLASIGPQSATENSQTSFGFSASDVDGLAPPIFTQSNNLPGSVNFSDNGNGTATLLWTPGTGDSGVYSMTVTATDLDGAADSETFAITVSASNAPVITPIPEQNSIENNEFSLAISATDPDGPAPLTLSETHTLPGTVSFTDNGDGTASFLYTPSEGENLASPYSVTITATDGSNVSSTETFVLNVNREGVINGVRENSTGNTNLTIEGESDWTKWTRLQIDRKAGVSPLISNWTPIGGAFTPTQQGNLKHGFTWSDGTPAASGNNENVGAKLFAVDKGFEFTAPAGIGSRQLRLYVSGRSSTGVLTASLSDGSAVDFVETVAFTSASSSVITLAYKSSTADQTLTVSWLKSKSGGYITLDAASLVEMNQGPALQPIGDQTAIENQPLVLAISATDFDGPAPIALTQSNTLPSAPTFVDNGDGTAGFTWTPAPADVGTGPFNVTLTATDAAGASTTESVTITVVENQTPVLAPIGDQAVLEGQLLSLALSASDDGQTPVAFTQTNTLPSALSFTDNGDGTADLSWAPAAGSRLNSPYSISVTATDSDGKFSTETFSVQVTASAPPAIAPISNATVVEGRLLSVPVTATDPDGNATLSLSVSGLSGLSISDSGNGTGTLTYVPAVGAANGSPYTVSVTATDAGGDKDVEAFDITVVPNQAPVLGAIGNQTATEGVALTVSVSASDADGLAPPMLSQSSSLPGSVAFSDNGNGTATLSYTPGAGDSGSYSMTVTATDLDGATDSETISIEVSASAAPVLQTIGSQDAIEDRLFTLDILATDADGPAPLTLTETNTLPGSPSILTDNGDGTGTISYTPQSGTSINSPYTVTVTATDGAGVTDSETFALTVNREGLLSATPAASPDEVDLTANGVSDWIHWGLADVTDVTRKVGGSASISSWTPINSPNLSRNGGTKSGYNWTDGDPTATAISRNNGVRHFQAGRGLEFTAPAGVGLRELKVYVGSNKGAASELTATLSDGSAAPVTVALTGSGKRSRVVTISYKSSTPNALLVVQLIKTGGSGGWISLDAATLEEFNQAPTLASIGDQTVVENQPLALSLTAIDADGPAPITLSETNTLPGAPDVLTDNGDGTGAINWTPAVGDAGTYTITVRAADDLGVVNTETITVTVVANEAPLLSPIGDQAALVNQQLTLNLTASDADGPAPISFSQTNTLPSAPTLTDNGDGTATLSYTPQSSHRTNSPYSLTVTATDGDNAQSSETISISVTASAPPVMNAIGNQGSIEGRLLSIPVSATDADGNATLSLAASALPGLALTDNGNGTGTINYVAPANSAGLYSVTVTATDTGGDSDSTAFNIAVAANQPPVITPVPAQTATEQVALVVNIQTSDADGVSPVALTQTNTLPGSPSFNDNGNGSATLNWTPPADSESATPYTVTVTATDSDGGVDSETFSVTVSTSAAPVIEAIGAQTAVEDQLWTVALNVTDPDGPAPLTLTATNNLPGTPDLLTDNGDGTGTLSYTPAVGSAFNSPYSITVTATDGAAVESSETFELSVNREGALAAEFEISTAPVNLTDEGSSDWIHWGNNNASSVNRKDGVDPLISTWTGIGGLTTPARQGSLPRFEWSDGNPNTNGSVPSGIKTFTNGQGFQITAPASIGERELKLFISGRAGNGRLRLTLSDSSAPELVQTLSHSGKQSRVVTIVYKASQPNQTITATWEKLSGSWITINAATLKVFNDAPELNVIGDQQVIENRPLAIALNATDVDGPQPLTLSQTNTLPGNPDVLTDNGDGTGAINWTPAVGDAAAGPYTMTVTSRDGEFAESSQTFSITVIENLDPELSPIGEQNALENQPLSVTFVASDIDGPLPLSFTQTNTLPGSPSFVDNGNGTATLNWSAPAGSTESSPYSMTVTANDSDNGTVSETFAISVTKSLPPILANIQNAAATEGRLLSLALSATDSDGPAPLVFTQTNNLPSAPALTDNGNGTATLTWLPPVGSASATPYAVTVTVIDDSGTGTADSQTFAISVAPNALPQISAIPDQDVVQTQSLSLNVNVTDTDGPTPITIAQSSNLPRGASIVDNGNGTAVISWDSVEGDASPTPYVLTITATDGQGGQSTQAVNVIVSESQPPVITAIDDQNLVEGQTLSVAIVAEDADGPNPLTLTHTDTLPGAASSLTDNGDGTGTLSWTSQAGQQGTYSVTVTATDGVGQFSTETFAVAVNLEGAIAGVLQNASVDTNLTEVGTQDWVKWGFRNITDVDRKSGVTPLINNYVPVNGATPSQHDAGHGVRYDFSDGTPTVSISDSRSGLRVFNNGKGYEFTVAADTKERVLHLYAGLKASSGTFTATLSDNSAEPVVISVNEPQRRTKRVTFTYKASTANQTLTVRFVKDSGSDWIALEAAALEGPPSLPFTEDFSAGAPGWSIMDESAVTSSWIAVNGEYRQDNNVGVNSAAMAGGYHLGTYSYMSGLGGLTDHSFSVTATPRAESGEDFGIMARVDQASNSYQRLSFSASKGFTRFESRQNGVFSTLARNARGFEAGTPVQLEMRLQGNRSIAYANGIKVAGAYDPNLTSGSVGLYCRDACTFDDVAVNDLPGSPTVAFASPIEFNVVGNSSFAVSAVALNVPTGGTVEFDVVGLTNACTTASEVESGYFTASCVVSGQGEYQLSAMLVDSDLNLLDNHTIDAVGVGSNYISVGDSITNGIDDNYSADASSAEGYLLNGMGYTPIAVEYLNTLAGVGPTAIANEGVPGDTSARILNERLAGVFERNASATDMVLMIGVNDAGGASFTPSGEGCSGLSCEGTFKGNLQAIINAANVNGIAPLIPLTMPRFGDFGAGVPPYTDPATNARNLLIRDEYNDVIANELTGNRTTGPDLYDLFLGQENRFYLYATNLHPNGLGYHILANEIFNAISGQSSAPFFVNNMCLRLTTGAACELQFGFKQNLIEAGDTLWPDLPYTLTSAPSMLDNGRWILPTDTNRNRSNADYLQFDVPTSSKIYVAYDSNAFAAPAWLTSGYTNTNQTLSTSNPLVPSMDVWVSNSVSGTQLVPAANAAGQGASANYLIIVVED